MILSLTIAFITSFVASICIIRTQKLHGSISEDNDNGEPQKMHIYPVPRVGGISIAIAIFIAITLSIQNESNNLEKLLILICAVPPFFIGLTEDLTKRVSIRLRLICTSVGALMAAYFLKAQVMRIDIPGLDTLLSIYPISFLLAILAITGLSNAYNIIDGFHGLSSMIGIITLIGLAYIGSKVGDPLIVFLSLTMASAILGFFTINYPRGLIFLGDGGAYLIGFWVAILTILLVGRHPSISPWFALLINGYPILETVFTIYRRKFHQGKNPGHPDGIHFHSLIYRRILNGRIKEDKWLNANARTAPYLWILASTSISSAVLFWQSTNILIVCSLIFAIFYLWLYKSIVSFKTPYWIRIIEK